MVWNYRLIKQKVKDGYYYDVREVYYVEDNPTMVSAEPISFGGGSENEVMESLRMALKDIEEHDPLDMNLFKEEE